MLHFLFDWEYPHWMMMAGAILVAIGFIGLTFRQNRNSAVNGGRVGHGNPTPTERLKAMQEIRVCRSHAEGEGGMSVKQRY